MNAIADTGRTALLVADFYPVVTELDHGSARGVLGRTQELIAAARDSGTMVIFCATAFRPTHVEVSANNKLLATRRNGPAGPQDPRTMPGRAGCPESSSRRPSAP